ncbi:sugar phosphate phosphatase [Clostridia bacterium]|nr:sugar phosphate phosphatase [Clostridia bacterium]
MTNARNHEHLDALRARARKIRLLATDLDGTLLNRKHELTGANRAALTACAEKGLVVCTATGRSYSSIPQEIAGLDGMRYLITANGAKIYDAVSRDILYESYLSEEAVAYVRPFLTDKEVLCEYFWDGKPHVEEARYHGAADYGIPFWFSDYFLASRVPTPDFDAAIQVHAKEIENINFVFAADDVKERVGAFLRQREDLYELTTSLAFNFEIGGKGVSKAAAVDFIAGREGIRPEETITFGDNSNDASMLRFGGIGVATANAVPDAIEAADYVTEDNEHDGVAKALAALGMIDK